MARNYKKEYKKYHSKDEQRKSALNVTQRAVPWKKRAKFAKAMAKTLTTRSRWRKVVATSVVT